MPARRQLTDADRVWNRACYREGANLREGDLALGALLLVDGYIQNGGVGHAFDLPPHELAEGIKGYEYFGLHEMAAVIKPHRGEEEAQYDARYYAFTGRPDQIRAKFEAMYSEHPERFAPIDESAAG
ncbi:MAG TPA: hypothetical protein VH475_09485 [Tepidisphaeraceae bacterium]|jgi:hypothetical protein